MKEFRAAAAICVLASLPLCGCSKQMAPSQSPAKVSAAVSPAAPLLPTASAAVAQQATATGKSQPEPLATDQSQGPFHIDGQMFTFVKRVLSIGEVKPGSETTADWWELRDANGQAVRREAYGFSVRDGRFETTEEVDARELKTQFGQGILVEGQGLPSAPNTGSWVQVFGLVDGKLVPFSSPVSTEGEFLEEAVDTFQPSAIFKGQQQQPVSRDVLKFRMWTGNFNLEYLVAIDWIQAKLRPAWTCMQRTSKGPSSACRYKVEVEPAPRSELTFVRLFNEPDEGGVPKHLVIKPESKIEFVEAEATIDWVSDEHNTTFGLPISNESRPTEKVWLHIRVDGQDGWIYGEEDFDAVGLPESG